MSTWFLSLCLVGQALGVARLPPHHIEVSCTSGGLGLLLPSNRQITFTSDELVSKVVYQLQRLHVQGNLECELMADNQPLPGAAVFCEQWNKFTQLRLVCGAQEHKFVSFTPPIRKEEEAEFLRYRQFRKTQQQRSNDEKEYPYTSSDIIGDNIEGSIAGYAFHFLEHHFGPLHPFNVYNGTHTGVYSLSSGQQKQKGKDLVHLRDPSPVRIAVVADFGAGTKEAAYVSSLMMQKFDPHFTLHAGDVYYVGDSGEMSSNMLGIPPKDTKYGVKIPLGSRGTFSMNGNHEMYSRGYGYYDTLLPTIGIVDNTTGKPAGQWASYSALENEYWRVINLDTGYNTYGTFEESTDNKQPDAVINWLKNEVKIDDPTDTRGIILFSHHQYFSAFGSHDPSTATPSQLAKLVPTNRTILWLWGHEHRLGFYQQNFNQSGLPLNVFGRCVGNGGFPSTVHQQPPRARDTRLHAYDDRLYQTDVGFKHVPVGYNGWTWMTLQNNTLSMEYRSLKLNATGNLSNTDSELLVIETFFVDQKGNIVQSNFTIVNPNITVVTHA